MAGDDWLQGCVLNPLLIALVLAPVVVSVHVYFFYRLLLKGLLHIRGGPVSRRSGWTGPLPNLTILIAAHNQEDTIAARLTNLGEQNYPSHLVEVIVASDGSTDGTVARAEAAGARIVHAVTRIGKSAIQNRALQEARGEFIVFTGTRSSFEPDFLRRVVDAFADPEVGVVDGRLLYAPSHRPELGQGQSAYWRMELELRWLESRLGVLLVCSGASVAVRREALRPFPDHVGEDCVIPLDAAWLGYRTVHLPDAIAHDVMKADYGAELAARIRMTQRNWQGTVACRSLLDPLRSPLTTFVLFSHKLLRWLLPYFVLVSFVAAVLLGFSGHGFGVLALLGYLLLAMLIMVGWLCARRGMKSGFSTLFAFVVANWGFAIGVARGVLGERMHVYHR